MPPQGGRGPPGVPEEQMGQGAGPADTTQLELKGQAPARTPDNPSPLLVPSGPHCPLVPDPAHLPPPVDPTDLRPGAVLEQGREGHQRPHD